MKSFKLTAAQTALLMAIFTLGMKVIGFIREMVLANYYGAGIITDSYVMAQSIPNMLFASLFSAVAISYMPTFSKKYELEGEAEANLFTSKVLNILVIISGISVLLGFLCPDLLVGFFAPEFSFEQSALTERYLRITMCLLLFSSVSTLLEAYLQYKGVFLPQIIMGYTQSAAVIVFTIISAYTSHYYLAFGILAGNIVRCLCIVMLSRKKGLRYTSNWKLGEVTKTIVALALPIFIGGSVAQINAFVDKSLASGLVEGSVAALNYANLISTMIQTVTATVLVTLIYPKLTQANSLQDYDRVNNIMELGMSVVFIIAVPCTLGAMVYSEPVIQAVYERGAFDASASALTAPAFFGYSVGILFLSLNLLLTKLYYSMGDTKTPVGYGIVSALVNIVLNFVLVVPLQQGGLALATSIAAGVNTVQLYFGLRRKYPQIQLLRSKRKVVKILGATAAAVAVSKVAYGVLIGIESIPGLISLGLAVCVAAVVYLVLLIVCKIDEVTLIKDLFHRG